MTVPFEVSENYDMEPHHFRVYEAASDGSDDWLRPIAQEYVKILSRRETSNDSVKVSANTVLDTSSLKKYLVKASIPRYETGNFSVVRSDFGELLCYILLERDYGTQFGMKSIYSRELRDRPGRGIDAIGVEVGDVLTLVLCEVKVSDERSSPPGVVDRGDDCLSKQHQHHLDRLHADTKDKLWRAVQKTRDRETADLLSAAALYLEENMEDRLRIIACNVLVRPRAKYRPADFGSFKTSPELYSPASIRFLVACIPDNVNVIIRKWYDIVQQQTEVSG